MVAHLSQGEGPARCTWGHPSSNPIPDPHPHNPITPPPKIMDSILDHIGNTPLVRLNRIPKLEGIECEILAKCEFFNAGGSVKDRIGKRMILDAEKSGRIKPGDVLIEPTSGNTGIGLALTAALKGYRMIITLPEKMSQEKVDVLKGFGAEIIRTPTEAAYDSPDSHIGVALRLSREIPNSHILDQYANPSNPLAHYDGTAEEILSQCDGRVDCVVVAAGTGGTITGIARKIRERAPNCKIVGVDPHGSILALPNSLNGEISSYKVEGIGYDFIPKVLDRGLVDEWVKTDDKESFLMSRRLIREEGLLVGGSSGSAMSAALKVAKKMKAGQRVVVILADSVRNYMSKFLNDSWMVDNGFIEEDFQALQNEWWAHKTVSELKLETPVTVTPGVTCQQCIDILNRCGIDQLPCVSEHGAIQGMITLGNLMSQIVSGRAKPNDSVTKVLYRQFKQVSINTSLAQLSKIFDRDHFALVVQTQKCYTGPSQVSDKAVIFGVVTRIDLVNFIVKNRPERSPSPSPGHSKTSS